MWQQTLMAVGLVFTVGCGQQVSQEDCLEDEAFVTDACTKCGNAGGCKTSEPACLPTCDDESAFDCIDGVERRMCD